MSDASKGRNLTELIRAMQDKAQGMSRVSLDDILEAVGRRSFAPFLLIAGLVTLAPVISTVPGIPSLMGLLVLLVSGQLLAGRKTFWLPRWLLKRSVSRKHFDKAVRLMEKPARWIDSLLGVRLQWLTGRAGILATAVACLLIALVMLPMEFVPFSVNAAGVALLLFGLGLMAYDGLVLILGFMITAATFVAMLDYFL